jgi:hypothetical protein
VNAKQRTPRPRRRIWVQHVAVDADKLEMRLAAAQAGTLSPQQRAIATGVGRLIDIARAAALREDPIPRRFWNWWRGTLVEAAYRNLHTARAQMVDLFSGDELRAEIPMALARARATLRRDDPRLIAAEQLQDEDVAHGSVDLLRARLRRVIGDSYEQVDLEHAQLRSFRNIVLGCALTIFVLVVATVVVVSRRPEWIPLCFPNEVTTAVGATQERGMNCPTSSGPNGRPAGADIVVVAMLGALGGALSAALSIRKLKGTSTPYDVSVAMAALKLPLGAFTAILALIAIQGGFIPGLSVLDSQGQILAYVLVFGFAQHALTRLLDQRAQTLLEALPGGTGTKPLPQSPAAPQTKPASPADTLPPPGIVEQPVEALPSTSIVEPVLTAPVQQPGDGDGAVSSVIAIDVAPAESIADAQQAPEVTGDGESETGVWEINELTAEEQQALMEETADESGVSCQVGDEAGWGDDEEVD